jgi:hypothetical protein
LDPIPRPNWYESLGFRVLGVQFHTSLIDGKKKKKKFEKGIDNRG